LRTWLFDGPAQLNSGPEAGAVAGTIEPNGTAAYVYGEITGYYLHWLASGTTDFADATRKAESALSWVLRRYGGTRLPPTRIYLFDDAADWRNRTQFCFDLAMLVGGLAKAESRGLIMVPDMLWSRLAAALLHFTDGGHLIALANSADCGPLPLRWSTTNGPFLAKAASRILLAPPRAAFPPQLRTAAQTTLDASAASAAAAIVEMLHPTLYAIEGAICTTQVSSDVAARWLNRVLAFDPGDGQLPEAPDSAVPRSDVIAQALRLAVWLRVQHATCAPGDATIESLVNALIARVRDDGSIAFRPDSDVPQINSWCAMFAEQALNWYSRWQSTGSLTGVSASDLV
jgi:hypothetical protein